MAEDELVRLFRDLRRIPVDTQEKCSRLENLTDILEIVAVAAGIKPSHMNAQGFCSERLLQDLEHAVLRHRLRTVRTHRLPTFAHRARRYESAIWDDQIRRTKESAERAQILWVFENPAVEGLVEEVLEARSDVSRVLGYPTCCVTYYTESIIRMNELKVQALKRIHPGRTPEEIVDLLENNVFEEIRRSSGKDRFWKSVAKFPFVQFIACPVCIHKSGSPADKINEAMKNLALSISAEFAGAINLWGLAYLLRGMTRPDAMRNPSFWNSYLADPEPKVRTSVQRSR